MNDLSTRLRAQRRAANLSQKELAALVGVAQVHISDIENKKRKPSIDLLQKLCGTLGCSADYLLGIDNERSYSVVREEKQSPLSALFPELLAEMMEKRITEKEMRLALKVASAMHGGEENGKK